MGLLNGDPQSSLLRTSRIHGSHEASPPFTFDVIIDLRNKEGKESNGVYWVMIGGGGNSAFSKDRCIARSPLYGKIPSELKESLTYWNVDEM